MTTVEFTKYIRRGVHNTSDNTLTEFTHHFDAPISLAKGYEVAITESLIPFIFYNVCENTYLQL